MSTIALDFEQAKARHLLFKTKLRSILYGAEIDETPVLSHHECAVGKWIYGHALNDYGHLPEMHELEKVHASIHDAARQLISMYKSGDVEGARAGLSSMELIADNLVALLTVMEMKLKTTGLSSENTLSQDLLSINYKELLELHKTIHDLDLRIQDQTKEISAAKKGLEKRLSSHFSQAPVAIMVMRGRDFMVETANELYLQLVDKDKNFIGVPLFRSLPELEGQGIREMLTGVMDTGLPFEGNELEIQLMRNGRREKAFFNFIYKPLREEDGAISGIIVVCTEVTESVNSKNRLRESERQFRNLVSQSPIAMAIFRGPDHVIEIPNNVLLKKLWRKELHEVEGKKLLDVFPELQTQQFPELLKKVYDTGVAYKENEALAHIDSHDGRKSYYLDFEYAPLFEHDGSVSGIMVTVNDVTEKVEARNKIIYAEERARLAIEGSGLGIFDLNMVTDEAICSPRFYEIFGIEYLTPHADYVSMVVPEDRHVRTAAYEKAFTDGQLSYDVRISRKDGNMRWIQTRGQVFFEEGKPVRLLGTLKDVTEQKDSEEALRLSVQKFQLLADSMPQFVWTGDASGNLNYFNQSVYDYSGLSRQQIEEEGWLQIVHPDDRDRNVEKWLHAVSTGTDFIYEHRFQRNDGAYRWQLSRAIPQRNGQGEIQMWVGTSTDIHDQKTFAQDLETQVELRTRELKQANIELEIMNQELTSFAYISSHDLQEPLRKIQTFVSRILESDHGHLSEQGKSYFKRMQNAANRMKTLINDLLTYSRTNAAEKVFEKTDLGLLLNEVKQEYRELLEEKQGVLEIGPMPSINGIPFQLRQMFLNLVSNSVKFSREGVPPRISITSEFIKGSETGNRHAHENEHYLHIRLSDNGIGFAAEQKAKIFEVFQRLHTRSEYEGTGIGLAICKKIVENHHGMIHAEPGAGRGAVFHIYIPSAL